MDENVTLVVEDDRVNKLFMTLILTRLGLSVVSAENGEDAIKLLDKNIKIIFMDICMPVMDGITATKIIRQNSDFNNVPIVAVTAFMNNAERDDLFFNGFNDYIPKPINKLHITQVLNKYSIKVSDNI